LTGVLVLIAAVYAGQRAAIDATYRELQVSADEAIDIIEEYLTPNRNRPGAVVEILGLLEGDELARLFGRIRRTAGGSEIGFALVDQNGVLRTNADLYDRLELVGETFTEGETRRTTSATGELVVVTPTTVRAPGTDVTLLVALAREAPIVRLRDQGVGLFMLVAGIVVLAALGARLLANQLARRLEPLADASRKVASGDMTARVAEIGDPDLDQVGAAFNDMAGELEETREREREFIKRLLRERAPRRDGRGPARLLRDLLRDHRRAGVRLGGQRRQLEPNCARPAGGALC
jgi:methyl-accepting chemotaxis protein